MTELASVDLPKLPHINEVKPRSESDDACFAELRGVLERERKKKEAEAKRLRKF